MLESKYDLLELAYIGQNQFSFTLPKKVRKYLKIETADMALGYFQEENGDISIGFGGDRVITTSEISSTYLLRLRKQVRDKLQVNLGDMIFFYKYKNKVIISGKQMK